jgi:hypothetical protein
MSANPEKNVSASITIYQEEKKELGVRKQADTYRVLSADTTGWRGAD